MQSVQPLRWCLRPLWAVQPLQSLRGCLWSLRALQSLRWRLRTVRHLQSLQPLRGRCCGQLGLRGSPPRRRGQSLWAVCPVRTLRAVQSLRCSVQPLRTVRSLQSLRAVQPV